MNSWPLLLIVLAVCDPLAASAQSPTATVRGKISDPQGGVLAQANVTLVALETGQRREVQSGADGEYRVLGLVPGRYALHAQLAGFQERVVQDIVMGIADDARIDVTLPLAVLSDTIVVSAPARALDETKTTIGQTIALDQINRLPIQNRDFTNLALLVPGVLVNKTNFGSSTPIVTAGQAGRNNAFLLDGLSLDLTTKYSLRGGVPLDGVQEFTVLTNGFTPEYGHASGAIVSVLSRSGTNRMAGRVSYYQRDAALDATPGAARLLSPPATKAPFELKTAAGALGGPIVHNHAFFFASAEGTLLDAQHVIVSPVLAIFRPAEPDRVPATSRRLQGLGRLDLSVASAGSLAIRYRSDDGTALNRFGQKDSARAAPERAFDDVGGAHDVAVLANQVPSANALNELRLQWATFRSHRDPACPGCFAENRPSILLGKNGGIPFRQEEDRWQIVDALTYVVRGRTGEHLLKGGGDVSFVRVRRDQLGDRDGTFQFKTDLPFDPADAETYPVQYTRTDGVADLSLPHDLYAWFVQDQWRPHRRVTVSGGLRWDRDATPDVPYDRGHLAPRLGLAWDLFGDGRTVLRGNYGRYIDKIDLSIPQVAKQAPSAVQTLITNPGYPNPSGSNPFREGKLTTPPPSVTRLADDMQTPYTEQVSGGVQRRAGWFDLSADLVWARGRHLLITRDLNYPDLTDPFRLRPNPAFQSILEIETRAHSWYKGLQFALINRRSERGSLSLGYTLSSAERDTEDSDFVPQDQRNYPAERGPSSSDVRHQLVATGDFRLLYGLHLSGILRAHSGIPYNITTGSDDNRDTNFNDRPAGVARNSAREPAVWQMDARVSRPFRMRRVSIEVLIEAFNLFNRRNWTGFVGVQNSALYQKPTDAEITRQVQIGVRVQF